MDGPASQADQGEGHRERSRRRSAALIAYFDTSAFLKLVVDEPGSSEAVGIWQAADRRVSSRLLYPEARAALAAAWRSGRIARRALDRRRDDLERLWNGIDCVEVTARLAQRAGHLAEELALRGYDGVHLASLEAVADAETVLAAVDTRLVNAAEALGISTARLV